MNMKLWKKAAKLTLTAAAAVVLLAAGFYGYRQLTKEETPDPGVRQATAVVRKGELTVKVSGSGSIEPVERKSVNAGISGTVAEVKVSEGDEVRQGDVLIVFEAEDASSQIRAKELELQRSLLDLEQLQETYKTANDEARRSIRLNIEKQRLTIASLEEELAELAAKNEESVLTAPIDGKIVALNVQAGDNVNTNAVVAEIANFNELQIVVPVDELDIPKVKIGQRAEIRVEAFPDEIFGGVVTAIADQGKSSNGVATFDVTVRIDEPGSIKSGMTAEASILVSQKSDVLLLPIEAVQSFGGRYYVLVPGAGAEGGLAEQFPGGAPRRETPAGSREPGRPPADAAGSGQGGANAPRRPSPSAGEAAQPGRTAGDGNALSESRRVFIEVGINNEDDIEIVSGLSEGDVVLLPAVSAGSGNQGMQRGFVGGGFFPGGPAIAPPGGGFRGGGGRP